MNLPKAGISIALGCLLATAGMYAQATGSQGPMGQMRPQGLFGPVSVHLKAGDSAPDLVFSDVLHTMNSGAWNPADLVGKVTVITFLPLVSRNPETVSMWNAVVMRYAGKPIQFVLIAGEKDSMLLPFLKEHPVGGWVFSDTQGQTAKAYGLEMPVIVIVGDDRRIIGFNREIVPSDQTLNAVLEGRIQTTPVGPTMAERRAFIESHLVLLDAEPWRMPGFEDHKPLFAPSNTLHVSPSKREAGGGNFGGDDFWSRQGYTLKEVIGEIYDANSIRIALPPALDDGKRYDFALVLPQRADRETMRKLARQGIEDYFNISVTRERRIVDVYVVTTVNGKPPAARVEEWGGGIGAFVGATDISFVEGRSADEIPTLPLKVRLDSFRSFSIRGATMTEFCHALESDLDRPVLDETELTGKFDFDLKGESLEGEQSKNDFAQRLRDQLHLAITPAQRNVETLAFYPR